MIRDITIGQYYPAESVVHKLDSRVKILGTLGYIISLFCFQNMFGYLVALLYFVLVVKLSKVPFRFIVKGLRPVLVILLFTAALNLFWTPGTTLVRFGWIDITRQGIERAIFLALRLIFLVLGSSIMTLTTTPNQLTDGIEKLLKPLNHIRVPVHEVAMMMSIALRFIPILIEETDKIMKAQKARGADFESGNVFQRLKNMLPILIPLFISAARRANDLALAMDARCYNGGEGRTKMKPLRYGKRDAGAYLGMLAYFVVLGVVVWAAGKLW